MAGRRHRIDDQDADEKLARAAAIARLIDESVERALEQRLPELLRSGAERRPPQANTPAPDVLGQKVYLSKRQVMAMTGYSDRTIGRYVAAGKLRPCGPARDRFDPEEVARFMAAGGADDEGDAAVDDVDGEVERLLPRK